MVSSTASCVLIAVLACLLAPPSFAALTDDAPYVEDVTQRITLKGATPIAGWGQAPVTEVRQTAAGNFAGVEGVWLLSASSLYFAQLPTSPYGYEEFPHLKALDAEPGNYTRVDTLLDVVVTENSRMAVDETTGCLGAVIGSKGVTFVKCQVADDCSIVGTVPGVLGDITGAAIDASATPQLWLSSSEGLFSSSPKASSVTTVLAGVGGFTALAWSPDRSEVTTSTANKFYIVSTSSATVLRWEWVTYRPQGEGGVVNDVPSSMAYDSCGALWIGNAISVNVMFPNRSFVRVTGLEGLPYNNITAVGRDMGSFPGAGSVGDMWIGTTQGVARYSPAGHGCLQDLGMSKVGEWVYYWGMRWLPGNVITSISSAGNVTYVGTSGGIARIEHETWTLQRKAELFGLIVPRHDRHGFTADCSLPSLGNISGIHCHPGESDGLWTGIMATAEVLRYAVKQDQASAALAQRRMKAMNFLSEVTGNAGYLARTAALYANAPHDNPQWFNSTTFPGWAWQGDTSADEVCGHMFAFPAAWKHLGNATGQRDMIIARIAKMIGFIVDNDYALIGHDGQPTKWGKWSPQWVNGVRSWSDQRGLNSLQILAFLQVAYSVTGNATFKDSIASLSNSTNQFEVNMINLKIEAPCDDNYSDDELAFLPFYSYLTFNSTATYAQDAMARSFNYARRERSSLWGAIHLAGTGSKDMGVVQDILWNLRTWPLEWIDWVAQNSQRIDIQLNPEVNRNNQHGTMSVRVLPCNERNHFRWNHNPFTLDGGSGMNEFDPGAWLSAYWMARYHGIIAAA